MQKEPLLVISGPSGIGKTFLTSHINALGFAPVLMTTTRKPGPKERSGVDYEFLDESTYLQTATMTDDFLMDNFFFGNYYGIRRSAIEVIYQKRKIPYLFIYIKVIEQIALAYPHSHRVYLKPHSFEFIERRLIKRERDGRTRIEKAREELLLLSQGFDQYYHDILVVHSENISPILEHLANRYRINIR